MHLAHGLRKVAGVVEAADRHDQIERLVLPGKVEGRSLGDLGVVRPSEPAQPVSHHRYRPRGDVRSVVVGVARGEYLADGPEPEADLQHLPPFHRQVGEVPREIRVEGHVRVVELCERLGCDLGDADRLCETATAELVPERLVLLVDPVLRVRAHSAYTRVAGATSPFAEARHADAWSWNACCQSSSENSPHRLRPKAPSFAMSSRTSKSSAR